MQSWFKKTLRTQTGRELKDGAKINPETCWWLQKASGQGLVSIRRSSPSLVGGVCIYLQLNIISLKNIKNKWKLMYSITIFENQRSFLSNKTVNTLN